MGLKRRCLIRNSGVAIAGLKFGHLARAFEVRPTAVIGCGNRGRLLAKQAAADIDNMVWAGFCDTQIEKARTLADLYSPKSPTFESVDELLAAAPPCDSAIVATPNHSHFEITEKLVRAGLKVYLEKPMAISLQESRRLVALDEQFGGRIQVGLQLRDMPLYTLVKTLVDAGEIGAVRSIVAHEVRSDWFRFWPHDPDREQRDNWRYYRSQSGGSIVEKLCHDFDIFGYALGLSPRWIQALGSRSVYDQRETIDNATVMLEYAEGVRLSLIFSLTSPLPLKRTDIVGERGMLSFDRTGTLVHYWDKNWPSQREPTRTYDTNSDNVSTEAYLGTSVALRRFIAATHGFGSLWPRPRDAWHSMVLSLAATRSADNHGTRVEVNTDEWEI